jgi:hypothetical protein
MKKVLSENSSGRRVYVFLYLFFIFLDTCDSHTRLAPGGRNAPVKKVKEVKKGDFPEPFFLEESIAAPKVSPQ